MSDVADKEIKKLEKNFKEGGLVRVRVLGLRHLEGLVTGVLKVAATSSLICRLLCIFHSPNFSYGNYCKLKCRY